MSQDKLIGTLAKRDSRVNHYKEIKGLSKDKLKTIIESLQGNHSHWARGRTAAAQDMLNKAEEEKQVIKARLVYSQF